MRGKRLRVMANTTLIVLFIALMAYATIVYGKYITSLTTDRDRFKVYLESFGSTGILIFMLFQFIQVVIAAIPGEIVQVAGGYIYGTFPGALYSIAGIIAGSVTAFYIARLLGYRLLRIIASPETLKKFESVINSGKSEIAIFILFLIPGMPKDVLTYVVGVTPVKPVKFFLISAIARFPALLVTSYIGSNLQERRYWEVGIASALALILFTIGIFTKDKLINFLHKKLSR